MCGQTPDQLQLRQLGIQGLGLVSPPHHHWIICVSGSGKTKQQEQDTEHNCPSCRYGVVFQGFQASPLLPSVAQVWAQLTPCDDELADLSLYTKLMSRQPANCLTINSDQQRKFQWCRLSSIDHHLPKTKTRTKRIADEGFSLPLLDAEGIFALGSNRLATTGMRRFVGPNRSGGSNDASRLTSY
jgi:hypothetical protein